MYSEVVSKLALMTCAVEVDVVTIEKRRPVKAKNTRAGTDAHLPVSGSGVVSTRS